MSNRYNKNKQREHHSASVEVLNIQDLKDDINLIKEELIEINRKTPRYYREQGDCFQVSQRDIAMSATDSEYLYLLNPIGSGKTIYLYNINMSILCPTHLNQRHTAEISIRKVMEAQLSGGTDIVVFTRGNMNIGNNNEGSAIIKTGHTVSSALGTIEELHLNDEGNGQHLDYQEEYIEIPEGYGLTFGGHAIDSDVELAINLRYIETVL